MIKKTDQNIKWHRLTTYRLRYLRFHLHICYKLYDITSGKFVLEKVPFPITADNYWQLYIRFVSEY